MKIPVDTILYLSRYYLVNNLVHLHSPTINIRNYGKKVKVLFPELQNRGKIQLSNSSGLR